VLSDVDGTLVVKGKVLTERARTAVLRLQAAGIRSAINSGRPPRGMGLLFGPLRLDTPIAGFNGGLFVTRGFSIVQQKTLAPDLVTDAFELVRGQGLDAWDDSGSDWLVTRRHAPMSSARYGRLGSSRR